MQGVYEIHLFEPIGAPQSDEQRAERGMPPRKSGSRFTASHYIGYAENIDERLEQHRKGNGSAFMTAVAKKGIRWDVARIWPGENRDWERRLKNQKNAARLCPICNPNAFNYCPCEDGGES